MEKWTTEQVSKFVEEERKEHTKLAKENETLKQQLKEKEEAPPEPKESLQDIMAQANIRNK